MFGYVVPFKPEMKIKEYELFRAYYCGVCKAMGRESACKRFGIGKGSVIGIFSRLALNYDSVFLGIFLALLNQETPIIRQESCIANPLKKKNVIRESPSVDYAAGMNIILTHYKLLDNWRDERDWKSYVMSILQGPSYRRIKKQNETLDQIVKEALDVLHEKEMHRCESVDETADVFASMLAEVVLNGVKITETCVSENVLDNLQQLGYHIGRWIYLMDAFDDMEKDQKSGSYNVLLLHYHFEGGPISEFRSKIKMEFRRDTLQSMAIISSLIEGLELQHKNIIRNIVYEGMYQRFIQVVDKGESESDDESI